MSLLDSWTDEILVFPTEEHEDEDGNKVPRPAKDGIPQRARIEPAAQSGTSARRAEQDNEGFESEEIYILKFPRCFTQVLGLQSQIEWEGARWVIFGHPRRYNRSRNTRHHAYTIKRY